MNVKFCKMPVHICKDTPIISLLYLLIWLVIIVALVIFLVFLV